MREAKREGCDGGGVGREAREKDRGTRGVQKGWKWYVEGGNDMEVMGEGQGGMSK